MPENNETPSFGFNNSLKFKYGSFISISLRYDNDESSMILLYPFSFKAYRGIRPIVSLNLKFIWVPIIGWTPVLDIFSANSRAPHKLDVSLRPKALIFLSL